MSPRERDQFGDDTRPGSAAFLLTACLTSSWMKNIHDDLSSLDLRIHGARDLAQNRSLSGDGFLCSALRTRSGACYYWMDDVLVTHNDKALATNRAYVQN